MSRGLVHGPALPDAYDILEYLRDKPAYQRAMEEILEVTRMAFEDVSFYRLNHELVSYDSISPHYAQGMLKMPKNTYSNNYTFKTV